MFGLIKKLFKSEPRQSQQSVEFPQWLHEPSVTQKQCKPKLNQEESPDVVPAEAYATPSADMLLLSKFLNCDDPLYYDNPEWKSVLLESPDKRIEKFVANGLLEPAALQELMAYKFKVIDLKLMLKERGLKVSGRKAELIQRAIEGDKASMQSMTQGLSLYRCTDLGAEHANSYLLDMKAIKNEAEMNALGFLAKEAFTEAARTVSEYEKAQVFQRGMGGGWGGSSQIKSMTQMTTNIFNATPLILKAVHKHHLSKLRTAAAMNYLWGTNTGAWLPDDFETGLHMDNTSAARMLIFHSNHFERVENYRKDSLLHSVEIIGVDDHRACDACKKIDGTVYETDNIPELPHPLCTCESGCRCTIVPLISDSFD